jgi:hypothetical protein
MLPKAHLRALLLIFLLAGCQSAPARPTPAPVGPTSVPTAAPRLTAVPPVTAVSAPTPPPSALVLWAIAEGPELAALRALLADLGQTLGVEVAVVGKSADGMLADIRADALSSVPPPDLLWGTQEELASLQAAGLLQPPDDRLDDAAFLPAVIAGATLRGRRWGTLWRRRAPCCCCITAAAWTGHRATDELIASARQADRRRPVRPGGRLGRAALVFGLAGRLWRHARSPRQRAHLAAPDVAAPQSRARASLVRPAATLDLPRMACGCSAQARRLRDRRRLVAGGLQAYSARSTWASRRCRWWMPPGWLRQPARQDLPDVQPRARRRRLKPGAALGAAARAQARIARELQRLPAPARRPGRPGGDGRPGAGAAASAERAGPAAVQGPALRLGRHRGRGCRRF